MTGITDDTQVEKEKKKEEKKKKNGFAKQLIK